MKKNFMKYSIWIWVWVILWIAISNISNVFGASDSQNPGTSAQEKITNNVCIEYTTPSWTGIKCDDVSVYLKTWTVQPHEYFLTKKQKTWSMTNFTTSQVVVQSGDYIQYKLEFGSVTGACTRWYVRDNLPSCVTYVSSEIHNVSGQLRTGNGYLQYSDISLNAGAQWYILVTWQITATARECKNKTEYINTWVFKCESPSAGEIYSSVVAIRTWWWGWWWTTSKVLFTKDWNKYEMVPGETWLFFTLQVNNEWPNTITGIVINDLWPNRNDCIIFDWWSWLYWKRLWSDYAWQYNGLSNNWTLRSWWRATLYLYAKIKDDPNCVWSYINTWKLTYREWWKTYELYDDYPFIVVDAGVWYDVSITKTADHNKVHHGESITYYIDYENIWSEPLTDYTIIDHWPNDDLEFISSNPTPTTNDGETITWFFRWPLKPWKSWRIVINAKVR